MSLETSFARPAEQGPKKEQPKQFAQPVVLTEQQEVVKKPSAIDRLKKVDDIFLREIGASSGDLSAHIEQIESLENLATGPIKESLRLGDGSVNAVTRVKIEGEGGKEVTGFMKPRSGEGYHDHDGTPLVYSVIDGKYFRNEDAEVSDTEHFVMRTWSSDSFQEEYAKQMAKLYKIPTSEFEAYKKTLKPDRFGPRIDIPPDGFIPREIVMSRMNMLCGFDVIPTTVAREITREFPDGGGGKKIIKEMASVQEGVASSNPEKPSRHMTGEEFMACLQRPPAEWHKVFNLDYSQEDIENLKKQGRQPEPQESMTRIASLDWLMGSQDRHFENFFIDPATGKMTGIDNGLHSGRARGVEVAHGKTADVYENGAWIKKKSDPTAQMRQLRSIPLEIMEQNKELKLSSQDQKQMQQLFEMIANRGPQERAVSGMFKAMFENEQEAKVQLGRFMLRLKHLAEHGRPDLKAGDLYPVGYMISLRNTKENEGHN